MRICINGIARDATPEEIAAMEQATAQRPAQEPTLEERVAAIERVIEAGNAL